MMKKKLDETNKLPEETTKRNWQSFIPTLLRDTKKATKEFYYEDEKLEYEINNNATTKDIFKRQISSLGLALTYADMIDSRLIHRFATMNDVERSALLEQLYNSFDTRKKRYDHLAAEMEGARLEMRYLKDQQSALNIFSFKENLNEAKVVYDHIM